MLSGGRRPRTSRGASWGTRRGSRGSGRRARRMDRCGNPFRRGGAAPSRTPVERPRVREKGVEGSAATMAVVWCRGSRIGGWWRYLRLSDGSTLAHVSTRLGAGMKSVIFSPPPNRTKFTVAEWRGCCRAGCCRLTRPRPSALSVGTSCWSPWGKGTGGGRAHGAKSWSSRAPSPARSPKSSSLPVGSRHLAILNRPYTSSWCCAVHRGACRDDGLLLSGFRS